jgi:RNA polymerase sigma factor for flagellar operon FliA
MTVQIETYDLKKQADKKSRSCLKTVALRAYQNENKSQKEDRQNKIVELLPLVAKLARKVVTYICPPLTFEDLVAAGTVGLVKAAKDYDSSHQANFKTYAYIRIRGAILDELKKWSFVPAEMNKKITAAQQAYKYLRQKNSSDPSDSEIAQYLNIPIEQLYKIYNSQRARLFLSIDSAQNDSTPLAWSLYADDSQKPDEAIERSELTNLLADTIQQLPEKKRRIIILYYNRDLTMKQIAEVLDITESRVSQLHSAALFDLSCKLREYKDARE